MREYLWKELLSPNKMFVNKTILVSPQKVEKNDDFQEQKNPAINISKAMF